MKISMMVCAGFVAMTTLAQTETHSDLGWVGDAEFWDTSLHSGVTTDVQRAAFGEDVEFRSFFENYYIVPDIFWTGKGGLAIIVR